MSIKLSDALAMSGIQSGMIMVDDFHKKLDISHGQRLTELKHSDLLQTWAAEVLALSRMLQSAMTKYPDDKRFLRFHLAMEELGEMMYAAANCDEVEVLDGLADRLYVLYGDALTWDLPLATAFIEVHRSNMTKEKQEPGDRIRDKGPNYQPADIVKVLKEHRGT